MQAIAFPGQRTQQLNQTLPAFYGIGVRDRHGILRGVPIAETDTAADFNE